MKAKSLKNDPRNRHTLILHNYVGQNCYVIDFLRVECTDSELTKIESDHNSHFRIAGWPTIYEPGNREWVPVIKKKRRFRKAVEGD